MREYDVVVVGFGLAGAVSAVEAVGLGASVLVVDRASGSKSGGNSLVSGQGFLSTSSVSSFLRYMCWLRQGREVAPSWGEAMADIPQSLLQLGVRLKPSMSGGDFIDAPGAHSVQRWRPDNSLGEPVVRTVQRLAREAGVEIWFQSRATGLESTPSGIEVSLSGAPSRQVRGRRAVILAAGGSAARADAHAGLTMGSPYATGDSFRLAKQLGGLTYRPGRSGPYYGFCVPGTRSVLTPWPLYDLSAQTGAQSKFSLFEAGSGESLALPSPQFHGLARKRGGVYYRPRMPDAELFVPEATLSEGPLVRQWPDGHAEGWGRRFVHMWSTSNQVEIERGWLHPRVLRKRPGISSRAGFVMSVRPALLNTLGGLVCDSSYRVLGREGPVRGLYAAGEIASVFHDRYQGSANLSECVISGRAAAAAALGNGDA